MTRNRKADIVQIRNPRSGRYVKLSRLKGTILGYKQSAGPYKGIPIARKRSVAG